MFKDKLVLTIDDSDTIRSYLKNVLAPLGMKVDGAATGEEGIEKALSTQYDLILLDLILPDADGVEILHRIREEDNASAIVMLTGHGGIKSATSAMQLGADGYIQKQEMTATVRDHSEFLYALQQAIEHRAGITAQKQLEEMRADFYSMVTHDLRNPAGIIQTALDMLEEEQLTSAQQECVSLAHRALAKMVRLIDDYLDYAQIDAGYLRLDQRSVDLRTVVEESVQLSVLQAHTKHQILTLNLPSEPVWAVADAERLKQVMDNLLSNACKYTDEGGSISVQLALTGNQAVFHVSDTGMGIPPEELPGLFTKYHRIQGEARRHIQGTGLGLIIVKEIVGAHGGEIQAKSAGIPGQGTTFSFYIPLNKPDAKATQAAEESTKPSRSWPMSEVENELSELEKAELYQAFVQEASRHVRTLRDSFRQLQSAPNDRLVLQAAQRASHTLKGDAGVMQVDLVRKLASDMDSMLQRAVKGDLALTTIHITDLARQLAQIEFALGSRQLQTGEA